MRKAEVKRETKETQIYVELNVDGNGKAEVEVEDAFFRHMIVTLAKFSSIDIKIKANGDLPHHIIEDTGITLGYAIDKAVDRESIKRFGYAVIPMDEALIISSVDMVRRPYFSYGLNVPNSSEFDPALIEHFFRSLAFSTPMTLHIYQLNGKDPHHIVEAAFKSFGIALKQSLEKSQNSMSVKGSL